MEIEARFINLRQEDIEQKLKELGAEKMFDKIFNEWIFFYKGNPDWDANAKRIRVRTDGEKTWITYKANATWEVDSTEEVEIEASSAEGAAKLIGAIGIPLQRYQEKKRISYIYDEIEFDLDFWPQIPMVLEIEAPTKEKVQQGAALLGLRWDEAIFVDQKVVHDKYYNIDLNEIKEYRFNE